MSSFFSDQGLPIGYPIPDWEPCRPPAREVMEGRYCRLEPLNLDEHSCELYNAISTDEDGASCAYLAYGPFESFEDYRHWLSGCLQSDPLFFAIRPNGVGKVLGLASYVNIDLLNGCIEVGHLYFPGRLKRTPAATEAMYLMMQQAFDLGFRRYSWKCDSLNAASRAAAERLGLSYEGVFRHANIYNGRNRDTAWFAAIDSEWPALRRAFETWLNPSNFDAARNQRKRLSDLTAPILKERG